MLKKMSTTVTSATGGKFRLLTMNIIKISISCMLVFSITVAFSQIAKPPINTKPSKKHFRMPEKITPDEYMSNTVVLKIKKDHRAKCSKSQINIAPLVQYMNQIGSGSVYKKFHTSQPPAREKNDWGQKYADLSLIYEFQYTANIPLEKVINHIYSLGIVEYAEPHYIHKLIYTPNDPQIGTQWHLSTISAYQAWNVSKGDTNVVIGIADTGTDIDHPDLVDEFKYNYNDPINGVDDDGDGYTDNYRGWDLGEDDNNPQVGSDDHGVHVAGCASPSTDNGIGVAGPGFNCKILPIKIANAAGELIAGYEGIEYAADHGADVINCSWGSNYYSSAGQDVIDYATINKDALVVGGAGNDGVDDLFYPGSYNYVINVASTESNDAKSSFSNYGYNIDVCAPGSWIYSTGDGNTYYNASGTSMSSPVAAGCAALIKSQFPFLNALQVGEQLKVTADDIYSVGGNGIYQDKLGTGRVNLYNAVSGINSPAVVMTDKTISDGNDEAFVIGDTLSITGTFVNYLAPTGSIIATLTTTSSYINIINSTANLGVIAAFGGTADNNADPFIVRILPSTPLNHVVPFELLLSDGSYSTKEFFNVTVNVDYINITINEVATSITSKSLIGYNQEMQTQGLGFTYQGGSSMLFEGGLMIGVPGKVSDWIRDPTATTNTDFSSLVNVSRIIPPVVSEFDIEGIFNDDPAGADKLDVEVEHKAFAWTSQGHTKYVIVEYNIRNTGASALNDLYAGIFADWDVMDYSLNNGSVDNSRYLGYCWSNEASGLYAGIQLLTLGDFVHYAIDNDGSNGSIDIYTSYNSSEKYTTLSTNRSTSGQGDVSDVVSSGPFDLAPGDSVIIAFALLAGEDLADLQESADSAYSMYNTCSDLTITFSITDAACGAADGDATVSVISGVPPFTYQWDANAGSQTTVTATGLGAGSYTVIVTDANGCMDTSTVNVSNIGAGTASIYINQNVSCYSGSDGQVTASITGGTGPYTYLWDDPLSQTNSSATGLTAGVYTVQITDATGCIVIVSETIYQPQAITGATSSTDDDGTGIGTATVAHSDGTEPYSYSWTTTPAQTDSTATGLSSGTYTVTVTDANGCIATFNVTVGSTSLIEMINESSFALYPNPNNGQFTIQFNNVLKDKYTIEVRNILGQIIHTERINISGNFIKHLDLSNQGRGIYFLNVTNSNSIKTDKLIIK
ncbi:MAG: S8 family serine peptidase [Bacteroidota bacterium]